jgi:hypothetical protein
MSFSSAIFNDYNPGTHVYTFTPVDGSEKSASLNDVIFDYNTSCLAPGTDTTSAECVSAIADMRAIYDVIKLDVSKADPSRNIDTQSELKRKLQSMHSETGILASQHSDYMSVVMSSVLWTTLAGGLIVYAVIKSRK